MKFTTERDNRNAWVMAFQNKDLKDMDYMFEVVAREHGGNSTLPPWGWDGSGYCIDVFFCPPHENHAVFKTVIALDHVDSIGPVMDFLRGAGIQAFYDGASNSETGELWLKGVTKS